MKKKRDLYLIAVFKLTPNTTFQFQTWMEQDHFPKMHATGCFEGDVESTLKYVDRYTSPGGCEIVTYMHKLKSMDSWAEYNKNPAYRKVLKAEFAKRWGNCINIYVYPIIMTVAYNTLIPGKAA